MVNSLQDHRDPSLPTFFVVGAMKSGTTALWEMLGAHPNVFMTQVKEPQFFSERANADWHGPEPRTTPRLDEEAYRALFADAGQARARGEATPVYLCDPIALERIRDSIPDARLIAILRQPVDRAYSAWLMKRREGWETLGFEEALAAERVRVAEGWRHSWHYAGLGRYADQLRDCYRLFDRDQVKVVLFDDLARDAIGLVSELYRFLGIDPAVALPPPGQPNVGFLVRSTRAHHWITTPSALRTRVRRALPDGAHRLWTTFAAAMTRLNAVPPPTLDPGVRARLTRSWHDSFDDLQSLIDRDLSAWRASWNPSS